MKEPPQRVLEDRQAKTLKSTRLSHNDKKVQLYSYSIVLLNLVNIMWVCCIISV